MLGVAEADLQLEGGFVRVKGAPGMRKSLAELVDANDRRSGASRWRVVEGVGGHPVRPSYLANGASMFVVPLPTLRDSTNRCPSSHPINFGGRI
jgi:hypothetical protein